MSDATQVVGRRIVAFLIDAAIMGAASILVVLAVADTVPTDLGQGSGFYLTLNLGDSSRQLRGSAAQNFITLTFLAWVAYFTVLETLTAATPGKLVLGLRVVKQDGRRAGAGPCLVRNLLFVVDGFPYVIPNLVGLVAAASSTGHRRFGDMAAGTSVVRSSSRRDGSPSHPGP